MNGRTVPADAKRTSVLRRVPTFDAGRYFAAPGFEGDVCAFQMAQGASPILVEATSGRPMELIPGDVFLATPGYRESTRWVVGGVPQGGLVPGSNYWMLAESGVIGQLIGDSPRQKGHLGQVTYLGVLCAENGEPLNIRQFATTIIAPDQGAPLFLVLGTSAEVGKTTAALAVLRSLRHKGHANVIALKATGTSSLCEIARYQDFGAAHAFDCVDFGMPTTYPSDREGIADVFDKALDVSLSIVANAVLVECGGDLFGANVPVFIDCLKVRRSSLKVILAAPDSVAALGGKRVLHEMGLTINLITGPCTDTPTVQKRTQVLCDVPAINMARRASNDPFI
jgi:hypothetical protein